MTYLRLQTYQIVGIMKEAENLNNAQTTGILNIPVVCACICYYSDNCEKYTNRYKKIYGESFINEREFILVEFIDGTCTSIDKSRLIYCH